jgi:hypothetical protein
MNKEEILRFLEEVAPLTNKRAYLKQRGVNPATYYNWVRKVKEGGTTALVVASEKAWAETEISKLKRVLVEKETPALADFYESLPTRTPKAIEAKLKEIGVSLREIKRKSLSRKSDKKCKKCGTVKPRDSFYEVKNESASGLHTYCKQCLLKNQSDYRTRNHKAVLQRGKNYRKKRATLDPDYLNRNSRNWRNTAIGAFATLAGRAKNNSRRGAKNFDLNKEEFKRWYDSTPKVCSYCETSLEDYLAIKNGLKGLAAKAGVMTIDRIDSGLPYSKENICFCCYLCNSLKGYIFTANEFKEIALEYIRPRLLQIQKSKHQ